MTGPSRRTVLGRLGSAFAVAALAGCAEEDDPEPSPTRSSPPDDPTRTPNETAEPDPRPDPGKPDPASHERLRWVADAGGRVAHAPTAVDGTVYVAGGAGEAAPDVGPGVRRLSALDEQKGTRRWTFDPELPPASSPVVSRDAVFLVGYGDGDGSANSSADSSPRSNANASASVNGDGAPRVFAVERRGGRGRWAESFPQAGPRLTLLGTTDETLFVGGTDDDESTDEEVYGVISAGGNVRWRWPLGDAVDGTVADGALYAGTSGGLYALRERSGEALWAKQDTSEYFGVEPLVVDDLLVVRPGDLVAFDRETGDERWRHAPGGGASVADRALAGGRLLAVTDRGTLLSLAPSDGTVRWRRSAPANGGDVVATERSAYVLGGGTLLAVDAETGTERWSASIGPGRPELYAAGDVPIVVRRRSNSVVAFGADGSERWRFEPNDSVGAVATTANGAYVGTGVGYLYALDP
ncbi:PQQ-binding-like beta-propeller repeat protein [Halegenticoccus soli]|uniref:PQQ-binding-like beta-propeller repeat protein n=1 Tax=Halegenticoccus soli TaxID=1985678 RepID=UPI000C6ED984|nr:PQQ-binding-like beta-propeller repeat protein [Halegenticoccus soli]